MCEQVLCGSTNANDFESWRFETLDISYDRKTCSVWMKYRADSPHCYTPKLLAEMMAFRDRLRVTALDAETAQNPVRYLVIASDKPGVYNLGGDLATFSAAIQAQNIDLLKRYAHACINLIDSLLHGLDLPIVIVSAVHGQCFGGAFEAALATDYIFAEEDARFAFPEVTFNTFPGMGAVSLMTRKLGPGMASKFILEGRAYTGLEMFELNAVDNITPVGGVRAAVTEWMTEEGNAKWLRRRTLVEARRSAHAITRNELIQITDLWAECATRITPQDLRHMQRIVNAQIRLDASTRSREANSGAPRP